MISRDKMILDYTEPLTYSLMMEYVELFAERYPEVSVTIIGESILGRSIPMVTLGNTEAGKGVLYAGTHHGMEWITSVILLRFINEFGECVKAGRQMYGYGMSHVARTRFISVVPMLNPRRADLQIGGIPEGCPMEERLMRMNGGGDFTHWQSNVRGVDLNHNYAAGFEEYKAVERETGIAGGCAGKYSGEYPESEPETAALASYLRWNDAVKAVLTLHTQGEIYCGDSGAVGSERLGRTISRMTGYRLAVPEGTAAYGGLTDWYTREIGRPAFTLECGKGENPLPLSDYFRIRRTAGAAFLYAYDGVGK